MKGLDLLSQSLYLVLYLVNPDNGISLGLIIIDMDNFRFLPIVSSLISWFFGKLLIVLGMKESLHHRHHFPNLLFKESDLGSILRFWVSASKGHLV